MKFLYSIRVCVCVFFFSNSREKSRCLTPIRSPKCWILTDNIKILRGIQHRLVVPLLDKIIYRIYFNFTRIMPPRKSNSMENINIHLRGFKANGCSLSLSLSLAPSPSLSPLSYTYPFPSRSLTSISNPYPSFSAPLPPLPSPPLPVFTPPTQRTDDLYRQNNNLISPQLGTIQNCTTKIINKFCADRSCRFQLATLATPYPPPTPPAHNVVAEYFYSRFLFAGINAHAVEQ